MTLKDFLLLLAQGEADAVDLYRAGIRRGMLDADPAIDPEAVADLIISLDDELDLGDVPDVISTTCAHCDAPIDPRTLLMGGPGCKTRYCSLRCLEEGTGEEVSDDFRATMTALDAIEPKPRKDH